MCWNVLMWTGKAEADKAYNNILPVLQCRDGDTVVHWCGCSRTGHSCCGLDCAVWSAGRPEGIHPQGRSNCTWWGGQRPCTVDLAPWGIRFSAVPQTSTYPTKRVWILMEQDFWHPAASEYTVTNSAASLSFSFNHYRLCVRARTQSSCSCLS